MMILDLDEVVFLKPLDVAGRVNQLGVVETRVKQVYVHSAVGADDLGYVLVRVDAVALPDRRNAGQLSVIDTGVKKIPVESVTGVDADEFGIVEAGVQEVYVDYVG